MAAYPTKATGTSRKIQPIIVTPRCLRVMRISQLQAIRSLDSLADAAPVDLPGTLQIQIEPDSRSPADQILVRYQTPRAAVFAVVAVVADHEVIARGHDVECVITPVTRASDLFTNPATIFAG